MDFVAILGESGRFGKRRTGARAWLTGALISSSIGGNVATIQRMPKMPMINKPLSPKAERFVAEMLANPTGSQADAAIRAGFSARSAAVTASRMLDDPRVKDRIEGKRKEIVEKLGLDAEDIMRDLFHVMTADARDLTEWHVGCCRYCWGEGNKYQRTPQEYRDAIAAYLKTTEGQADPLGLKFDHAGGVGYWRHRDPNPACPECFGDGEGRQVLKDTRRLSPAARAFYSGVETTKHGVKVATRDKDKARDLAARALGVVRSQVEVTGKGGGPVQHAGTVAAVTLTTTDPVEAATQYQKLMGA